MQFDTQPPSRFLGKKSQRQMLMLIAALAIIIVAIKVAALPSSWYWLTGTPTETTTESQAGSDQPSTADRNSATDDDDRVVPSSMQEGEFIAQPDNDADADNEPLHNDKVSADSQPKSRFRFTGGLGRIDPQLMTDVADNTGTIRTAEQELYEQILAHVANADPQELKKVARRGIPYSIYEEKPGLYRGRLVTVRGALMLVHPYPKFDNIYGLGRLYEAWIKPDDTEGNLYYVVTSEIPNDIPIGTQRSGIARVEATGYFFKIFGYATENGSETAPMILTASVDLVENQTGGIPPEDGQWLQYTLAGSLVAIIVIMGFVIFRTQTGDKAFDKSYKRRITSATDEQIDSLENIPSQTTDEFLDGLDGETPAGEQTPAEATPEKNADAVATADPAGEFGSLPGEEQGLDPEVLPESDPEPPTIV